MVNALMSLIVSGVVACTAFAIDMRDAGVTKQFRSENNRVNTAATVHAMEFMQRTADVSRIRHSVETLDAVNADDDNAMVYRL